jgi:glycosyltransferase involved in cell wall biosynthesis
MSTASNTPLVSVIVPMYGVENYISRCAKSLFAQTYLQIEFIFVDDGGKDRTVEILRGILAEQEPSLQARVRLISKVNEGLPRARKTGLDVATGEYVLHVDSDDWLEPETVEKLVRKAVETEADIVVYDFWKEYLNRRKLDSENDSSVADPDLFRRRLYDYKAYGYVWNKFCRRSLYEGVFVPKYAMHEDIVFSTQILYKSRKIVHLKEGLYHYDRSVSGSATRAPQKVRRGNSARNLLDLYLHFEGQDPSPVSDLREEIFLRAAWAGYSQDRNLFVEYPFLAPAVRAIPITHGYHIGVIRQSLIKLFLRRHQV